MWRVNIKLRITFWSVTIGGAYAQTDLCVFPRFLIYVKITTCCEWHPYPPLIPGIKWVYLAKRRTFPLNWLCSCSLHRFWTEGVYPENKCRHFTSLADCNLSKNWIFTLAPWLNRNTFSRSRASVNQEADWAQAWPDHRELPHLFTGLLVSLLLLSIQNHAHAAQSQSEETNPKRLATPTLIKATSKNVISPISRLIKQGNRQEFEKIIWREAVMCFPSPSTRPFLSLISPLSGNCCESKYYFFRHSTSCVKMKTSDFLFQRSFVNLCDFRLFWATEALVFLGFALAALCEQSVFLLHCKNPPK